MNKTNNSRMNYKINNCFSKRKDFCGVFISVFLLIAIIFTPDIIYSQNYTWKTPQPVTDSLSNNRNPVIGYTDYVDGPGYYVFWERSTDTLSTDIFVKNIYSSDDPQPFIFEGDFHYQNPQFIGNSDYYPVDSLFYLVFESDELGNKDIFVIQASPSTTSELVAVSIDPLDDNHMRCNSMGSIVWENNGRIMFSAIDDLHSSNWSLTSPVIISDSNCYNPVISCSAGWYGREYIAWEQHSDSTISIVYSTKEVFDSLWSDPLILYDSAMNRNVRFNNDFWNMGMPLLVWDHEENGIFKIMGYGFEDQDFFTSDFSQSIPFCPTTLPVEFLVSEFHDLSFIAFEWIDEGYSDILVSDEPWISQEIGYYVNISESLQVDRNPQLYEGLDYSYYKDVILIWESNRADNWQLWSSIYTMPMGGVADNASNSFNVKAYPNPFATSTTIRFELDGNFKIQMTIFNSIGELVYQFEDRFEAGNHTVKWSPSHLPAGLYYAVLRNEEGISVVKMVKQ